MEAMQPTSAQRAGTAEVVLRPMRPGDEDDVRRIFRETLCRGRQASKEIGDLTRYEQLSLGWYLEHGQVILAVRDGRVGGYLLACLDERAHHAWQRRHAARWVAAMVAEVVTGRRRGDARRFVQLRLQDGWMVWRHGPSSPAGAHAHVNLDPLLRASRVGPQLARTMDALVHAAGLDAWYGQMNRPASRRLGRLDRTGARVAGRRCSATLSWLADQPIDNITLVRQVDPRVAERAE